MPKHIRRDFYANRDRYVYDFELCQSKDGWQQYDTTQDASYFGVWVNRGLRMVVTYAEGDQTIATFDTQDEFELELAEMAAFYGPPPPMAVYIDTDGQITEIYDERPA